MQVYKVINATIGVEARPRFARTIAEAQAAARQEPKSQWPNVSVELLDIPTDAASIIALLNAEEPPIGNDGTVATDGQLQVAMLRCWELSPRGALRELAREEW